MDLFISYRRAGGTAWADLMFTKLNAQGLKIFYDKHKIHNEDFEKKIRNNIENSPNILLILSPGIFTKRAESEKDWVLAELKLALELNKNIIAVCVDGFDAAKEFASEEDTIQKIKKLNFYTYITDTPIQENASITNIMEHMKDSDGNKFPMGERISSNSWYAAHEMTDEDKLWIISDHDVCKKLDWSILKKACEHIVLKEKKERSLFVLKAYDIDTYKDKYSFTNDEGVPYITNVYGLTYESDVAYANSVFGENHFIADNDSDHLIKEMDEVLKLNHLTGFDLIDMTLVVKDTKKPEYIVREAAKRLNRDGGVIYIRELDDDYVDAYPDENGLIQKMIELLDLDDGAGNRHTGKKVYTYLKKAGADKVVMSDQIVSTANHKSGFQKRMCDTYFSFLLPEMRELANQEPDVYGQSYSWLQENYDDVESLFCSQEFYFRAGYVAGYGIFEAYDEEDEY